MKSFLSNIQDEGLQWQVNEDDELLSSASSSDISDDSWSDLDDDHLMGGTAGRDGTTTADTSTAANHNRNRNRNNHGNGTAAAAAVSVVRERERERNAIHAEIGSALLEEGGEEQNEQEVMDVNAVLEAQAAASANPNGNVNVNMNVNLDGNGNGTASLNSNDDSHNDDTSNDEREVNHHPANRTNTTTSHPNNTHTHTHNNHHNNNHNSSNNSNSSQNSHNSHNHRTTRTQQRSSSIPQPHPLELPTDAPIATVMANLRSHPRYTHSKELLFRVALSEEIPIIRAEINWSLLTSQLPTYPSSQLGDYHGLVLLLSILRMDPPTHVVREAIKLYPKSCTNMDSFFAACQYSSDDVVQLVMRRTLRARKREGIRWGMVTFLGDARVRTQHAKFLLRTVPEALVDPQHGVFGVSPLDRMMSGAFIHGHDAEWVEKLKLALLTAEFGNVDIISDEGDDSNGIIFHPFHDLIQRIISPTFMGVQFGALSFLRTLAACVRSELDDPPFHRRNGLGDLPLHVALQRPCHTNLGMVGERKLIQSLTQFHPESSLIPDHEQKMPLRLSIENGWPCYDIITNAMATAAVALSAKDDGTGTASLCRDGDTIKTKCTQAPQNFNANLALHIVLSGTYHPRFQITGARKIIQFLLSKYPNSAQFCNEEGRLPLHLAIENGWPCHDLLLAAAPPALETRDVKTGLYPFQMAAILGRGRYAGSTTANGSSNNLAGEDSDSESECEDHAAATAAAAAESKTSEEEKEVEHDMAQLNLIFELIREGPLMARGLCHDQKCDLDPRDEEKEKEENVACQVVGGEKKRRWEDVACSTNGDGNDLEEDENDHLPKRKMVNVGLDGTVSSWS